MWYVSYYGNHTFVFFFPIIIWTDSSTWRKKHVCGGVKLLLHQRSALQPLPNLPVLPESDLTFIHPNSYPVPSVNCETQHTSDMEVLHQRLLWVSPLPSADRKSRWIYLLSFWSFLDLAQQAQLHFLWYFFPLLLLDSLHIPAFPSTCLFSLSLEKKNKTGK